MHLLQVELTLGGPVAPGHRRPLAFQLDPLAPASSTSWETELRVSGFGWPAVQPALRLPIKVGVLLGRALWAFSSTLDIAAHVCTPCVFWPGGA